MEWPRMLLDKDKLLKLYRNIFETIAEIHKELYIKTKSVKQLGNFAVDMWSRIFELDVDEDDLAEPFEHYNIFEDVQKVYSTDMIRNKLARNK